MLDCAGDFDLIGSPAGWWECNLTDSSLSWSSGVYDLFGFPREAEVTRDETLARYTDHSRAILERLRTDAIHNACGFTLDAELKPPAGAKWVRIVAAPDLVDGRVVRLHGLKFTL